ncbi:MAG TPA: rod shape-determining protein MreD [Alphaproteobacteria bacterium]|nr:rod shape-determining protein MreD [Alphaproteobacteria bacterium]
MLSSLNTLLPWMTIFIAMVFQETAIPSVSWEILRPDMVIIGLFYWRMYRPDLCGPILAFSTGLLLDIISTTPLGLNALSKTVLVLLIGRYGKVFRALDFIVLLPIIAIFVIIDETIQWIWIVTTSGYHFRWDILIGRPVATMIVMPLMVRMLIFLHRSCLEAR